MAAFDRVRGYFSHNGKAIFSRLVPYWLTVIAANWVAAFLYIWMSTDAWTYYNDNFVMKVLGDVEDEIIRDYGATILGIIVPTMIAATIAAFLLTDTKLPTWRFAWVNKGFAAIRRFRAEDAEYGRQLAKRNQFATGEPNFNMLAIWLIAMPCLVEGLGYIPFSLEYAVSAAEEHGVTVQRMRWVYVSSLWGWASVLSMTFFLVPVARHSVLLTAMGWSPIHALRIHIWAGYLSFAFAIGHAYTMFIVYWIDQIPLRDQFIPRAECWAKDANFTVPEGEPHPPPQEDCLWQYWNLTGGIAAVWFVLLWATSLNWVRRKNYWLFYVCHVVFGTLLVLCTILHFDFSATYFLPSTAYYLASTAPTLIQALAARYRGGNKILRVVALQDAGGCVEFHVAADSETDAIIKREPGLYVKLCVPAISLVWHPFTVYRHPNDHNVVRVLFRPIGPFTKQLALHMTAPERPVTILDGFYRGSDRIAYALRHDHVTIVSGGVAITPFLSFIPSLLQAVGELAQEDRVLKGITFHWAVRERGLEAFITDEFLRYFIAKAHEIGFAFQIKVYQTGRKAKSSDSENPDLDTTKAEPKETQIDSTGNNDDTSSGSDSAEDQATVKVAAVTNTTAGPKELSVRGTSAGFAMEVARMMPARFSQMQRNIPYAACFVCFMWLAAHITFQHYDWNDDYNFSGWTQLAGWTILIIVLSPFYGAVVEGGALLHRKFFPEPQSDTYVLEKGAAADRILEASVDLSNVETFAGRPTQHQLLADAKVAEAPGIFLCGPAALCDGVWREVRKENSLLGRTRYCMYDEPFEM